MTYDNEYNDYEYRGYSVMEWRMFSIGSYDILDPNGEQVGWLVPHDDVKAFIDELLS